MEEYYITSLIEISIFTDFSYDSLMIHTITMKVKESFWENDRYS